MTNPQNLNLYVEMLNKYCIKKADVILRNSIRMLKEMNFQVLVEGIETDRHRRRVEDLGVDLLQGYYFSRPLPRDVFLDYVENFKPEDRERS